jgi:hypothetical protein
MPEILVDQKHFERLEREKARLEAHFKAVHGGEAAAKEAFKSGKRGDALSIFGSTYEPAWRAALGGAGTYLLLTSDWFKDIKLFQDHWYLKPLIALGIGLWLWRRGNVWAQGIIAAAAAMFIKAYQERPGAKGSGQKPADAAGFDWERPWEEPALPANRNTGAATSQRLDRMYSKAAA